MMASPTSDGVTPGCVLPTEIMVWIIEFLPVEDLCNVRLVCKFLSREALRFMYSSVDLCFSDSNKLHPSLFYDLITMNPHIKRFVKNLNYGFVTDRRYRRSERMKRLVLLWKHSCFESQFQVLVKAGVIDSDDKTKFQRAIANGDDDPIWLIIYSMLPNIQTLSLSGPYRSMPDIIEKLARYLVTQSVHSNEQIHEGQNDDLKFSRPGFAYIFTDLSMNSASEIELINILLFPTLRAIVYHGMHLGKGIWSFRYPSWLTESGYPSTVSKVKQLFWDTNCFPPNELVKILRLMPHLLSINFNECVMHWEDTSCSGFTFDYYDASLSRQIRIRNGEEYLRELKASWQVQTGNINDSFHFKIEMPPCKIHETTDVMDAYLSEETDDSEDNAIAETTVLGAD